jgi:hypothetical protein
MAHDAPQFMPFLKTFLLAVEKDEQLCQFVLLPTIVRNSIELR